MKRTFRRWASALALGLMTAAGALVSAPASAAPIQTVTNGGVTCGQYSSGYGTFPTTFWDCITPATNTSNGQALADAGHALPANIVSVLTTKNTELYLFSNATAYASFSGGTAITGALGAMHTGAPGAATVTMAAVFSSATIQGTVTSLTPYYAAHTRQQLGRIYGANAPNNAKGHSLKPDQIFFEAAINDDRLRLSNTTGVDKPNYPSSATVWGSAIASLPANVGKSPWEILANRYGNTESFIYGFQVGRQTATATLPDLNTVLQTYMQTTRNWVSQQVYLVNTQNYDVQNVGGGALTNAVLCVEQNGVNIYPLTWWSCVQPYTPTVAAQAVGSYPNTLPYQAPTPWQTLLKNSGIKVYAMRDVDAFVNFFGSSATVTKGLLGILGASKPGVAAAAFQDSFDTYAAPVPPSTTPTYTFTDRSGQMSGTILHELGHQFDTSIWVNIAVANSASVVGSVRWHNAISADVLAFNALSCATAIDADRTANGKAAICGSKPAGVTNFQYLGTTALPGSTSDTELWARAFQRRAGGAQPAYEQAVQIRLGSNMQTYMNDLWTNGPHN